jgi:hypothetical protein
MKQKRGIISSKVYKAKKVSEGEGGPLHRVVEIEDLTHLTTDEKKKLKKVSMTIRHSTRVHQFNLQ